MQMVRALSGAKQARAVASAPSRQSSAGLRPARLLMRSLAASRRVGLQAQSSFLERRWAGRARRGLDIDEEMKRAGRLHAEFELDVDACARAQRRGWRDDADRKRSAATAAEILCGRWFERERARRDG